MTMDMSNTGVKKTGLELLRVPFEAHQIKKLPKGGVMLDYVGHAAMTDRLLDADPNWSWEPLALDEHGLPKFDDAGGLWIRLTVCGMTRLGYGDAQGKAGGNAIKECIGDALRNAAMRFGAALDLWHKGELHMEAPQTTAQKMITADIQPTAGAVQVLSNNARESVTLTAQLIKEAVSKGNTTGALNVYMDAMGRDNTDEKVALKRMLKDSLAKDEAKALRVAYDEFCRGQIAKIPPVKFGAEPDIHDVRAHLANGDMDSAADLAKGLTDPAQRKLAEAEVLAAHKQMSHA